MNYRKRTAQLFLVLIFITISKQSETQYETDEYITKNMICQLYNNIEGLLDIDYLDNQYMGIQLLNQDYSAKVAYNSKGNISPIPHKLFAQKNSIVDSNIEMKIFNNQELSLDPHVYQGHTYFYSGTTVKIKEKNEEEIQSFNSTEFSFIIHWLCIHKPDSARIQIQENLQSILYNASLNQHSESITFIFATSILNEFQGTQLQIEKLMDMLQNQRSCKLPFQFNEQSITQSIKSFQLQQQSPSYIKNILYKTDYSAQQLKLLNDLYYGYSTIHNPQQITVNLNLDSKCLYSSESNSNFGQLNIFYEEYLCNNEKYVYLFRYDNIKRREVLDQNQIMASGPGFVFYLAIQTNDNLKHSSLFDKITKSILAIVNPILAQEMIQKPNYNAILIQQSSESEQYYLETDNISSNIPNPSQTQEVVFDSYENFEIKSNENEIVQQSVQQDSELARDFDQQPTYRTLNGIFTPNQQNLVQEEEQVVPEPSKQSQEPLNNKSQQNSNIDESTDFIVYQDPIQWQEIDEVEQTENEVYQLDDILGQSSQLNNENQSSDPAPAPAPDSNQISSNKIEQQEQVQIQEQKQEQDQQQQYQELQQIEQQQEVRIEQEQEQQEIINNDEDLIQQQLEIANQEKIEQDNVDIQFQQQQQSSRKVEGVSDSKKLNASPLKAIQQGLKEQSKVIQKEANGQINNQKSQQNLRGSSLNNEPIITEKIRIEYTFAAKPKETGKEKKVDFYANKDEAAAEEAADEGAADEGAVDEAGDEGAVDEAGEEKGVEEDEAQEEAPKSKKKKSKKAKKAKKIKRKKRKSKKSKCKPEPEPEVEGEDGGEAGGEEKEEKEEEQYDANGRYFKNHPYYRHGRSVPYPYGHRGQYPYGYHHPHQGYPYHHHHHPYGYQHSQNQRCNPIQSRNYHPYHQYRNSNGFPYKHRYQYADHYPFPHTHPYYKFHPSSKQSSGYGCGAGSRDFYPSQGQGTTGITNAYRGRYTHPEQVLRDLAIRKQQEEFMKQQIEPYRETVGYFKNCDIYCYNGIQKPEDFEAYQGINKDLPKYEVINRNIEDPNVFSPNDETYNPRVVHSNGKDVNVKYRVGSKQINHRLIQNNVKIMNNPQQQKNDDCFVVYDHCNYEGKSLRLCGEYPEIPNELSGFKIFSYKVPQNVSIKFFESNNDNDDVANVEGEVQCLEIPYELETQEQQ